MQILYFIGDLSQGSVERQLVDIIQDYDSATQTEIYDGTQNIGCALSAWFIVSGNIDNIKKIIHDNAHSFNGKICTLSGVGGVDGSIDKVRQVYGILQSVNANIVDSEFTIIPITSQFFECPSECQVDLFWQKEALLKAIGETDKTREQQDAINKVARNYLTLMKAVAVSADKPTYVKMDYPDIQTDAGRFELLNLPEELAGLQSQIDELCSQYEITDGEIEKALLELIDREW